MNTNAPASSAVRDPRILHGRMQEPAASHTAMKSCRRDSVQRSIGTSRGFAPRPSASRLWPPPSRRATLQPIAACSIRLTASWDCTTRIRRCATRSLSWSSRRSCFSLDLGTEPVRNLRGLESPRAVPTRGAGARLSTQWRAAPATARRRSRRFPRTHGPAPS